LSLINEIINYNIPVTHVGESERFYNDPIQTHKMILWLKLEEQKCISLQI